MAVGRRRKIILKYVRVKGRIVSLVLSLVFTVSHSADQNLLICFGIARRKFSVFKLLCLSYKMAGETPWMSSTGLIIFEALEDLPIFLRIWILPGT